MPLKMSRIQGGPILKALISKSIFLQAKRVDVTLVLYNHNIYHTLEKNWTIYCHIKYVI